MEMFETAEVPRHPLSRLVCHMHLVTFHVPIILTVVFPAHTPPSMTLSSICASFQQIHRVISPGTTPSHAPFAAIILERTHIYFFVGIVVGN